MFVLEVEFERFPEIAQCLVYAVALTSDLNIQAARYVTVFLGGYRRRESHYL